MQVRLLAATAAAYYRDIRLEGSKQNPQAFDTTFEQEDEKPLSWFAERIKLGKCLVVLSKMTSAGRPVSGRKDTKVSHKVALWG